MNTFTRTLATFALIVLFAAPAWAGANETPGENGKPHRFSFFSPNLWEFGAAEKAIFQEYVVELQHYSEGSIFEDKTLNADTGGAGLWNFFEFCSNGDADVLFLSAHGLKTPPHTIVATYKYNTAGVNQRNADFTYYSAIFPGCLRKVDYPKDGDCSIEVNQQFYTNYFQTPQALAWWSTCYSSLLSLTGTAEARLHVGYDNSVSVGKCICDEKYILRRMNGHEGQDKRPYKVAELGVNGACPPGGANLVAAGALNTTLSPSVVDYQPRGIVCSPTPGHVKFDTSMNTDVDPSSVVIAEGDGYLINHAWSGDDRIDYTVIPTSVQPVIQYRVREKLARSDADNARLDGNTNPTTNAYGPNRDDFIWDTTCPPQYATPPVPLYPVPDTDTPTYPGASTTITIPTHNGLGAPVTLTGTLTGTLGWPLGPPQDLPLEPGETGRWVWDIEVPENAEPGDVNDVVFEMTGGGAPEYAYGSIIVEQDVIGMITGGGIISPEEGVLQVIPFTLENQGLDSLFLTMPLPANPEGWPMTVEWPTGVELPSASSLDGELRVWVVAPVPPAGHEVPVTLGFEADGFSHSVPLGTLHVGAPLKFAAAASIGIVPGNTDATLASGIANRSTGMTIVPNYFVTDSNGHFAWVDGPASLAPGDSLALTLHLDLPPDPLLVGESGSLRLTVIDLPTGLEVAQDFAYVIEPALSVSGLSGPATPLYTGVAGGRDFPWQLTFTNESDLPLTGDIDMTGGVLMITPSTLPLSLLPGESLPVEVLVTVPEDHPADTVEPMWLEVFTASGLGDRFDGVELWVHPPVRIDMLRQAVSHYVCEYGEIQAALENLRPDASMTVDYDWWDEMWTLVGPLTGNIEIAPLARDTVTVNFDLPCTGSPRAVTYEDSVSLHVHMLSDGGMPIDAWGSIRFVIIDGATPAPEGATPAVDRLLANWPNPFNPVTQVRFHLSEAGVVRLEVMDVNGRRVATVIDRHYEAGVHDLSWEGVDDQGTPQPSGVYFLRLSTDRGDFAQKAILLK